MRRDFEYLTEVEVGSSVWEPTIRRPGRGVKVMVLDGWVEGREGYGRPVMLAGWNRERISSPYRTCRAWQVRYWHGGQESGDWVQSLIATEEEADFMIGFREEKWNTI